jgi:hypothetical protein
MLFTGVRTSERRVDVLYVLLRFVVAVGVESAEMRSRFLGRFELAATRLVYEPAVIVVVVLLLVELWAVYHDEPRQPLWTHRVN